MPPTLEQAIICDDVRLEVGNKVTLVGVYGKHIFLPRDIKFPGRLTQLCIFTRWLGFGGGEKVFVGVEYENEVFVKPEDPNIVTKPNVLEDFSQLSFNFPGFLVKGFGQYRVKIYLGEPDNLFAKTSFSIDPQPSPAIG